MNGRRRGELDLRAECKGGYASQRLEELTVLPLEEYRAWIGRLVESASPAARREFCRWALDRFPERFGEVVWDGLDAAESERLRAVLTDVESALSSGVVPPTATIDGLRSQLDRLGPADDIGRIEVHPDATEFMSSIYTALEFLRTGEPRWVVEMSAHLVNSVDYNIDVPPTCGPANMLAAPEMRAELLEHERVLAAMPIG